MTEPFGPVPPTILHLDMDSFYVSVERLLDASLIGKPVVVGGPPDSRGVVASASYEAREFGIHSAMPSSQAARLCPRAIFVHGTYARYAEYSAQVHEILDEYSPLVQMASQDEAYVDLTGTERLWGSPWQTAHRVREAVTARTKLPCSAGVATGKLIAKIASDLCKPKGLLWIPAGSEEAFLRPLPVKRMPGIGPKATERLEECGLKLLGDIQRLGAERMKLHFGEHGAELYERAMGRGSSLVSLDETVKSVSHETTFEKDTSDALLLSEVLSRLCEKVASRLRGHDASARTVSVKFRYAGFETHSVSKTLSAPFRDEGALFQTARELLEERRESNRPLRLIGVAAEHLEFEGGQLDLLAECEEGQKRDRLLRAIDGLRDKHGFDAIGRASSRRDGEHGPWG
ncbi:DNA polymerase IV [Candidatus Poribacteria bacterium]|nr:DNA polymerase IV [Candidatus Poribacteria bacterium]